MIGFYQKVVFKILNGIILTVMVAGCTGLGIGKALPQNLALKFNREADLEIGSPYVGLEFHRSYMIPQRISFFYPVANSIDFNTDYWNRDTSFIMDWYLKVGKQPVKSIGKTSAEIELTPYSVVFRNDSEDYLTTVSYRFSREKPATILSISIRNNMEKTETFQLDTRLRTALKTCHTYKLVDQATTEVDSNGRVIYANFNDPDVQFVQLFVANAGERPNAFNSRYDSVRSPFSDHLNSLDEQSLILTEDNPGEPVAQFVYSKKLKPGESLEIVQIIGTSQQEEGHSLVAGLLETYQAEVMRYEQSVTEKVYESSILSTGNPATDHSVAWAKAVMEVNKHFLNGEIVPMPCPAEYNFYFAHDALVTDLAAVNFDLARVRADLEYIVSHANAEKIIPHAYYWKDREYRTEFASSDNWNNFWIVLVTASYLRHSGDTTFVQYLYPYISTSVRQALLTLEDDDLMWSFRPDWWDIGKNYGPRSYMTILAARALSEYIFISTTLQQNLDRLQEWAATVNKMQRALVDRLWSDEMQYLINYHNDGSLDEHYYIGSLLAAHYGFLDDEKQTALVKTAKLKLVDNNVGVYNAFPMDFHEWIDFLQFSGNEAGSEFVYFNGGIWPQGNAWYSLALIANGEKELADRFISKIMSLHGIMNGPNGQPAYYEVRNANRENPAVYGTVDKPQFLWAGAWYLYSLYNLYGVRENGWNIHLEPYLSADQKKCQFSLNVSGNPLLVNISGRGESIQSIRYDRKDFHSAVFPIDMPVVEQVNVRLGKPRYPYLQKTNAILTACEFQNRQLIMNLKAFSGHTNETVIVSPQAPRKVRLNEKLVTENLMIEKLKDHFRLTIRFSHSAGNDILKVNY